MKNEVFKNKKKNFIWNTIGITAQAFTSLFFLIIINRINGITEAGIFSYTFSIACLFYIIALYYNRTFQVADVENTYSNNEYISNRLITSGITLLLLTLFILMNKFDIYKIVILIFLMCYKILEAISDCFHAFIQKKEELYFVGKSLFWKSILGIVGFGIVDYLTKNIMLAITVLLLVNIIGLFLEIKKYKTLYECAFVFQFDKKMILLKKTMPLFFFSFLSIYLCNCQKYVMEYFMDEQFQTILGIIIMPATMLSLCGQYLISPYLNELSIEYHNKTINVFKNRLYKINITFLVLGIFIFLVAFFLGIPILNIVYSITLNEYKSAFLWIILGAIFYALSTMISSSLTIMKRNKEQLFIFIISSIFSTNISIILIKNYGIKGASYSYVCTMLVHFILLYILLKKYLKNKNSREVNK